jgi:predicted GIY-YIG superfamily endonuclease
MYHSRYILQSIEHPENHYVGYTTDIKKRLAKHSEGRSSDTSKYKLWKIKVVIAFDEKDKALTFKN